MSASKLGGLFWLNRSDSGLVGLFGRDRSDPAAHAKHYGQISRCLVLFIETIAKENVEDEKN